MDAMCSSSSKRVEMSNYQPRNADGCGGLLLNNNNKKKLGRKRRSLGGLRKCSTTITEPKDEVKDESFKKKKQAEQDIVNLWDILFTKDRDFLITHTNHLVQATHLEGKVIVLHFVPLVPWSDKLRLYVTSLVDIYNAIHPKGAFEVVFVGVKFGKYASNPQKLLKYFQQKFSIMPWLAIPFSDINTPEYWEARLRFPFSPWGDSDTASVVIHPSGVVLKWCADDYFLQYGVEAYPFTDKRINFLISQDKEALKHPSITNLLASPQRDYVINNKNQEVPVHTLEDKVVALYFYHDYPLDRLTKKLEMAYKQLADKNKFEIVLVYIHDSLTTCGRASEESFYKSFNSMPWLALPFKDQKCKNLQRIFNLPIDPLGPWPDPSLVIIGPQGKFVEPYGVDILENFGISAYPFSRKRVAELEADYINNLKLEMFWYPNTSFLQKDGTEVKLSQLVGKRIILVAQNDWFYEINGKFWRMLEARYARMNGTTKEFEVIHICEKQESSIGKHCVTMPWLRHPPLREGSCERKLLLRLLGQGVGLIAFDGDGRVVRRTPFPWIEKDNMDFPFYAGGLEEEAVTGLIERFEWYYWDDSDSPLTIYQNSHGCYSPLTIYQNSHGCY